MDNPSALTNIILNDIFGMDLPVLEPHLYLKSSDEDGIFRNTDIKMIEKVPKNKKNLEHDNIDYLEEFFEEQHRIISESGVDLSSYREEEEEEKQ